MILPKGLPDETLSSLLSRLGRLNGLADLRDVAVHYFGNSVYTSFIDGHINIPEFCKRTRYAYGAPAALLRRFSYLGVRAILGELTPALLWKIQIGECSTSLGEMVCADPTVLGYCPACAEEDIQKFGIAYWHRIHQPPVVWRCVWHGNLLVRVCVKRAELHYRFPLPGDYISKNSMLCAEVGQKASLSVGIAKTVLNIAEMPEVQKFADDVDSTILLEMRASGLFSAGGIVLRAELISLLVRAIKSDGVLDEDEAVRYAKRALCSQLDSPRGMILGRAVLVHWLFGNWDAFREKCHWTRVFGHGPDLFRSPKEPSRAIASKEHHRRICMDYLRRNPACSRLDFTRGEYRSFRWLLHHDKAWLDYQLPMPKSSPAQYCLF